MSQSIWFGAGVESFGRSPDESRNPGRVFPDCGAQARPSIRASVTGLGLSIPFARSWRRVRASVRGRRDGRHLMGSVRIGRPIYGSVVAKPLPGWRPDLIHRPGVGTSLREAGVLGPPEISFVSPQAAAAAKLNSVASTHMRCRMTASLRASATLAVFMPARLAIRAAQLLSAPPLIGRVRMTWAAS